jgi:hypothetical protein
MHTRTRRPQRASRRRCSALSSKTRRAPGVPSRREGVTYIELLILIAILGLGFLSVARGLRGTAADVSTRSGQALLAMSALDTPNSGRAVTLASSAFVAESQIEFALNGQSIRQQTPVPSTPDEDDCSGWRCTVSRAWDATQGAFDAGGDVLHDFFVAPIEETATFLRDPRGTVLDGWDRLEEIADDPWGSLGRIVWDDEASELWSEGDWAGAFGRAAINTGTLAIPVVGPIAGGRRFFDQPTVQLSDAHQELLAMEPIPHEDVGGWGAVDTLIWQLPGQDERVFDYKDSFVEGHRDIILAAAEENDIPPELLAGVAWIEVGGDPDVIDDLAYALEGTDGELTTSIAPMSIQVRRAAETLGYDPENMTAGQMAAVRDTLKDPQSAIFLAARHLAELREVDYPGTTAAEMTDQQLADIATRYNRGPDVSLQDVQENGDYGDDLIDNRQRVNELLED